VQYLEWLGDIIFHFDFGYSFLWMRPVDEIIVSKMPLTAVSSLLSDIILGIVDPRTRLERAEAA